MSSNIVQVTTDGPLIVMQAFNIESLNKVLEIPESIMVSVKLKKKNKNETTNTTIEVRANDIIEMVDGKPVSNIQILINFIYMRVTQLFINNKFNIAVCSIYDEYNDPYCNSEILELLITKNKCKLSDLV